jgi:hypothetical protein
MTAAEAATALRTKGDTRPEARTATEAAVRYDRPLAMNGVASRDADRRPSVGKRWLGRYGAASRTRTDAARAIRAIRRFRRNDVQRLRAGAVFANTWAEAGSASAVRTVAGTPCLSERSRAAEDGEGE